MDPLSALRDFAIRGELSKIIRSGDEFLFSDVFRFPCAIETAFRSKQGSLYPLEVLVYFLHHHNLKHTDYILAARRHGVAAVTLPDRKPLLDYLLGKISSSESIVQFDLESLPPPDENPSNEGMDLDVMETIMDGERPLRDRNALLVCRNRNFFSVYAAAMEREEKRKRMDSQQRKDGLVAKSRLMEETGFDSGQKSKKVGDGVPIILVPSASSTLITIYNVKEFLEDGVFIPTELRMKQMKGPKPECVTVQKKFGRDKERAVQAYEVRDKPTGLKPEDWDRVVAVFVLGKEWQFKEWPYKDHVEIFNKIVGFFVRFEDDSVESAKTVKQWNVKIISISKTKRHQDRAAALDVWDKLEEFMRARSHS